MIDSVMPRLLLIAIALTATSLSGCIFGKGSPLSHTDDSGTTKYRDTGGTSADTGLASGDAGATDMAPARDTGTVPDAATADAASDSGVVTVDASSTDASADVSMTTFCTNRSDCDDNDPCTSDRCLQGMCINTMRCNDNNPCTTDSCNNGTCSNTPNIGMTCDDGLFCTTNDQCDSSGTCAGTQRPCPQTTPYCDEVSHACICQSNDDCMPGAPICDAGSCRGCQDSTECASPQVCDASTGRCVACVGDMDCPGGTPYCDTNTNTCVACTADAQCNDGNPCTNNVCINNTCTTTTAADGTSCGAGDRRCCAGHCRDLLTDGNNCGACGATCASSGSCSGGQCGCTINSECPFGQTCTVTACTCVQMSGQCCPGNTSCSAYCSVNLGNRCAY